MARTSIVAHALRTSQAAGKISLTFFTIVRFLGHRFWYNILATGVPVDAGAASTGTKNFYIFVDKSPEVCYHMGVSTASPMG